MKKIIKARIGRCYNIDTEEMEYQLQFKAEGEERTRTKRRCYMNEKKKDSLFDMWTRSGTKEEEKAYESGIAVIGVIAVIFMVSVLIMCLMEGGTL